MKQSTKEVAAFCVNLQISGEQSSCSRSVCRCLIHGVHIEPSGIKLNYGTEAMDKACLLGPPIVRFIFSSASSGCVKAIPEAADEFLAFAKTREWMPERQRLYR